MKRYDKILIIFFVHLVLFFCFLPFLQNICLLGGHFVCCLMSFCIITVLLVPKKLFIFEPIILFSLFDYFIIISYYYVVFQGIKTNLFIQNYSFSNSIEYLLLKASLLNFIGYLFCISGYYMFRKKNRNRKKLRVYPLNTAYTNVFIFTGILIGLLNFAYNNLILGDNAFVKPQAFLTNINIINQSGTTLGYNLFIWAFLFFLLKTRKRKLLFKVFFCCTIFLSITTGRIFQSLVIIIHVLSFDYFLSSFTQKKNRIYIFRMIFLLFLGIFFYILRYYLSAVIGGVNTNGFIGDFIRNFIFFAFDKGNLPSMAIQIIILDGWSEDIGFMLGKSFIYPIFSLLPSQFHNIDLMPGVLIKNVWFTGVPSGNLPATGIGELYANFGVVGVCVGMFIFGVFGAYLFNIIRNNKSPIYVLIAIIICNSFFILFPKGEINNLSLYTPFCIFIIYKTILLFSKYQKLDSSLIYVKRRSM